MSAEPVVKQAEKEAPTEIGDIVFFTVLSFLRWCLRNVKGASNLIVFAMIIVFVNYSQDVVQLTLEAAVNANPAYDTSYELKAAAAGFTNEIRSFADVAQTAAASFKALNASCLTALQEGSPGATFLQTIVAMQDAFGEDLYYLYVSFRIPGTQEWGDCGCQQMPNSDAIACTYIDRTGTNTMLTRGDPAQQMGSKVPNSFVTSQSYITNIAKLTAADQALGVWQLPAVYNDPLTQQKLVVMTYSYPIDFDPVTGLCTLAASVDVSGETLRTKIALSNSNKESILLDARQDATFILSTRNTVFGSDTVYPAIATPSARINTIVSTVLRMGADPDSGLMQNVSFLANGLRYESLTIMDTWVLVSRSPAANGGLMMASAFQTLMTEYERVAKTALFSAQGSRSTCMQTAMSNNKASSFLSLTQFLQQTFGSRVVAIFSTYLLPNSSATFGACGCEFRASPPSSIPTTLLPAGANAPPTGNEQLQQCFYVGNDGSQFDFSGGSFQNPLGSSGPFFMKKRAAIVSGQLSLSLPSRALLGWSNAYLQEGSGLPAMTYSVAKFDPVSKALVAGGHVELSLGFIPDFFRRYQTNGTDYFLLDTRPPVYVLGCLAAESCSQLAVANNTRNATINTILGYLMQRLEFDLSMNASLPYLDFLINFQVVPPYFAIVELLPQRTATQLFFPVPAVQTVSDALHLIPPDQTMGLFFLVCVMLMLFTLNMFLLGCSNLSEAPGQQPPAPAPPSGPPAAATTAAAVSPAGPAAAPASLSPSSAAVAAAHEAPPREPPTTSLTVVVDQTAAPQADRGTEPLIDSVSSPRADGDESLQDQSTELQVVTY